MKNLILETGAGDNFDNVKKKAKELAKKNNKLVEFDFNGVKCIVSNETNLDALYRDYTKANLMEWKVIGPNCVKEYSKEVQDELDRRTAESEEKYEKEMQEYRRKEEEKKLSFNDKIKDEVFECSNEAILKDYEEKNQDPYGGRCVSYAKEWARAMQFEMKQGKKLYQVAQYTSSEADYDGITGFMLVVPIGER